MPRQVVFRAGLPRNPSGKTLKRLLRRNQREDQDSPDQDTSGQDALRQDAVDQEPAEQGTVNQDPVDEGAADQGAGAGHGPVRYDGTRARPPSVTLNRPRYRNAQNSAMTYALDPALDPGGQRRRDHGDRAGRGR